MCNRHPEQTFAGESLKDGGLHEQHHRTWSRRQFLGGLGLALAGSAVSAGSSSLRAYARSPLLDRLASLDSDRILILIQLSGGNDGLNTVIPVSNDIYYQMRPSIAISPENALLIDQETGLHPQLQPLLDLYGQGKMSLIHGVGYPDPQLSHFTSTDVWIGGGNTVDVPTSGWLGRSLDHEYPAFADEPPAKPIAVQLGAGSPRLFQGASGNLGMSLPNLDLYNRLVTDGKVFDEAFAPETVYGSELAFVRSVANDSFQYAEAVTDADSAGENLSAYPSSSLSGDLSVVARLIRGSLGTSIYHLSLGGFDTHSAQTGRHRNLMRELGESVGAFMADLSADGLDERVLVATFSEFGRRVQQNASGGTDHGTAAPMFVVGGGLSGGMVGHMPSLTDLDYADNLKFGIDFRSVYATLLVDWLGVEESAVPDILGQPFDRLGFVDSSASVAAIPPPETGTSGLGSAYPNPFSRRTTLELDLSVTGLVEANLFDARGRKVQSLFSRTLASGRHTIIVDGSRLAAGAYFVRVRFESGILTRKIIRIR